MPGEMTSWADEIDETDTSLILPPPSEKWVGNQKITTEYSHNDDGKKVKIIRTFKIEKKLVSKAVARRKALAKFGMSRNDRPGPNPATTIIGEDVYMNFLHNKEESEKDFGDKNDNQQPAESGNKSSFIKCRICKDNHMTHKCPYKDTYEPLRDSLFGIDKDMDASKDIDITDTGKLTSGSSKAGQTKTYVPPSLRGEDGQKLAILPDVPRRPKEENSIRISNLSEHATEDEISELCKQFGNVARIFLAKEKYPERGSQPKCKGFAFVNYFRRDDAAKAIAKLNGFGYDHLILNVEWAKPSAA